MILGFIAVTSFSLTLPLTKATITVFGGWTVGLGRAALAGLIAAALLGATRTSLPDRTKLLPLLAVSGGVVFGFPVFTALALEHVPASRGVVVVGLLPVTTALVATIRHGERPSLGFWLAAGGGVITVIAFAVLTGSRGRPAPADALLVLAILAAAVGYAQGAELSKSLGGWQTICWALVLSLPLSIPTASYALAKHGIVEPTTKAMIGFGYVTLVSMLTGFFVWYAALSIGGTARVSQVQLVQPLLSLGWARLLLDESITKGAVGASLGVLFFVVLSKRAAVGHTAESKEQSDRGDAAAVPA